MRKSWALPILMFTFLLAATGCGPKNAQPLGQPTPTEQTQGQGGVDENNIAPASPGSSTAPVKPTPTPTPQVTKTIALYYADKDLNTQFRVKTEITADTEADLPKAALNLWMKGPKQAELANLVPPGVVVESIEIKDGVAYVSFSSELKNANLGSGGELYLLDQIALIMKEFGYDKTQILIEGQIEETLLGHVSTDVPLVPSNPEDYEWME